MRSDLERAVESAIVLANGNASKLPAEILKIKGHGTNRVSHFFNAICAQIPECRYLEFGTFAGRSLAAAAYNNSGLYTGVDKLDWTGSSVLFSDTDALKSYLASSIALCRGSNVGVVQADFRLFEPTLDAYDVFFYDADHGYEATRDGIAKGLPLLKPGVLIVDDYLVHAKSPQVRKGTQEALSTAKVGRTWTLGNNGWHTGIFVAVVG